MIGDLLKSFSQRSLIAISQEAMQSGQIMVIVFPAETILGRSIGGYVGEDYDFDVLSGRSNGLIYDVYVALVRDDISCLRLRKVMGKLSTRVRWICARPFTTRSQYCEYQDGIDDLIQFLSLDLASLQSVAEGLTSL